MHRLPERAMMRSLLLTQLQELVLVSIDGVQLTLQVALELNHALEFYETFACVFGAHILQVKVGAKAFGIQDAGDNS